MEGALDLSFDRLLMIMMMMMGGGICDKLGQENKLSFNRIKGVILKCNEGRTALLATDRRRALQ